MSHRLFQLLIVNLGIAIIYAIQKKVAWKVADAFDNAFLRGRYERELDLRRKPYPKPRRKNLYYRDTTDWE